MPDFRDLVSIFNESTMKNTNNGLIVPNKLNEGDTIGIISPASSIKEKELNLGINILEKAGFKTKLAKNVNPTKNDKLISAPCKQRVEDFMWAFEDNSVDAVFAATGGFGSAELLPCLDYDSISKNPKIFVGYSDITALSCALLTKCNMMSFSGSTITG